MFVLIFKSLVSVPLLQEIVTWYNAIRAARYAYLRTEYPTGRDAEVSITPSQNHND